MSDQFTLIGVDGGATKVSAWIVYYNPDDETYTLSNSNASVSYGEIEGYAPDFKTIPIDRQLDEFSGDKIFPTPEEQRQGHCYTQACARVIAKLAKMRDNRPVLVGIGMPGLKTPDRRGIAVLANGPRIPAYTDEVESELSRQDVKLISPIAHLGSDADYCGIGEAFARDGSFRDIINAYYLGGGTGTADALLLRGDLVPFDQTKSWMAKTWEMKNDDGISIEKYASASGIQYLYAEASSQSVEQLNRRQIYPPQVATLAMEGDSAARQIMKDTAENLALLLYERITTLCSGHQNIFSFVNPKREALKRDHPFREERFERMVIGQRLGELMHSRIGKKVLTLPLIGKLSGLLDKSDALSENTKSYYLHDRILRDERLIFSNLREAPALGAGIDAHLFWQEME